MKLLLKCLTLTVLIHASSLGVAQNPSFEWMKSNHGYQGTARANAVEIDSAGNIYSIGKFTGTVDFNPSLSSSTMLTSTTFVGGSSSYIQKLDAAGNLLWVKKIDFKYGGLTELKIDHQGYLNIIGNFMDTVDVDPSYQVYNLASRGDEDVLVIQLSANGNFEWGKSFGGISQEYAKNITIDEIGNLYIIGSFADTVDFDPGVGETLIGFPKLNNESSFLQKLDKNGNFVWVKTFLPLNDWSSTSGEAVGLDYNGNIYCRGYFTGFVDIDPDITFKQLTGYGIYLIKLDSNGNYVWDRNVKVLSTLGGNLQQEINLTIDNNNNIYASGGFSGYVDFAPGIDTLLLPGHSNNQPHSYLLKFNDTGNLIWANTISSGLFPTIPNSLTTDTFGNVYSTGIFYDSTDLDPGPDTLMVYANHPYINTGGYIQKLNTSGELIWAGGVEGTMGYSGTWDIEVDGQGNVFTAGYFQGTVDFDIGPGTQSQNAQYQSYYLLKLSQCKTITTDYVTACDSVTWIDGLTYHQSTTSAYFTLPGSSGCDSVICLALTIPAIDPAVNLANNGATFVAAQPNASYRWLDCNNGMAPLPNDTLQWFTPAQNGDYAVEITLGGCTDTSACTHIGNVGFGDVSTLAVKLFPNPNHGSFTLDLGSLRPTGIAVANGIGQQVFQTTNPDTQKFDLALEPGVYFLKIQTTTLCKVLKFVVE